MMGQYSFVTERCPECGHEQRETCASGTIGIEVRSADRRWWYDCVYRAETYSIALEVLYTHATTQEKIEATRQSGMQIAEFRADEINAMEPGAELSNLQMVTRICGQRCEDAQRARKEQQWLQSEQERVWALEVECTRGRERRREDEMRKEKISSIAQSWRELKRQTEAERAQIKSDFVSNGCDKERLLTTWAELKSRRTAARALLLAEWREVYYA
jgi:hypothetical protein